MAPMAGSEFPWVSLFPSVKSAFTLIELLVVIAMIALLAALPAQWFYRAWQTNGPKPALDMSFGTEIPLTGAAESARPALD